MPSGNDHIPGIRKNAKPDDEAVDFMGLTDDEQRKLLDDELVRWQLNNLDVSQVPHNIFNMDCMLIALVRVLMKELGIDEDRLNAYYRHVTYEKLTDIRKEAMISRIKTP